MIRKVYQRLWSEDRYLVLARSEVLYRRIDRLLLRTDSPYRRVFRLLRKAVLLPEVDLESGVAAAWNHLKRRATPAERAQILSALARDPAAARLRLHSLARKYGDGVLLASRLFMHPSQINKVWIEGKRHWTLHSVFGPRASRRPLWFIAYQLASMTNRTRNAYRFGEVLRLLDRRPYSYFELTRELGQHWHHALRECVRRLLIYPLCGKYYLNARMAPLFLDRYDDAVARGVTIRARRWSDGKCEIRYSDGQATAVSLTDLVGGLYDLAGAVAGRDAYGLRAILRYLRGAGAFSEERLRVESGKGSVRYPLQKLRDQGLVVAEAAGRYRVAIPLDGAVRFYEKVLRDPSSGRAREGVARSIPSRQAP